MKPKLILLPLFALIIGFGFMPADSPVYAQVSCGSVIAQFEKYLNNEQFFDGTVWHPRIWEQRISGADYVNGEIRIRLEFSQPTRITELDTGWLGLSNHGSIGAGYAIIGFNGLTYGSGNWGSVTSGTWTGDISNVRFVDLRIAFGFHKPSAPPDIESYMRLFKVNICGENLEFDPEPDPEYYQPLKESENAGTISNPLNSSATNFFSTSNNQHATVHAATDGIITVERLALRDCVINNMRSPNTPQFNWTLQDRCYFDGVNYFSVNPLSINMDIAKIILNGDDGSQWEYWVHSPFLYSTVRSGDFVRGGCPIGGTIATGNQGVTIVFERGGDADVDMTIEPTGSDCSPELSYDGCITGSRITIDDWDITGGRIEQRDGNTVVSFDTVGAMQTLLNVAMDRVPKLRIYVYSPQDAKLGVQFGDKAQSFNITSPNDYTSIDVDLADALPDRDPFFTLKIILLQPSKLVYISYVCLFLDDEPPREYCYFLNHDFSSGLSEWDRSDSSVVPRSNNAVSIPDGESISQLLKLVTGDYDDDLEFNVRIEWGVFDNVNSVFVDDHYLISLEYKWGGYTDDQFQEIGMATRDIVADTNNNIITAFNLLISQNTEDDFELRISHSDLAPPPTTLQAEIRSICLTGDMWAEDKPVPPFNADCPLGVTRPTGSDIGLWIGYLWSELNRFFTCDLMRVLNAIHNSLIDFFDTSRYFMRYLLVSGNMTLSWFSTDMLYWLNGHLSNIAGGNVTFIEVQGGRSCNNLFCVIDGLFGGFNNLLGFLSQLLDQALAPIIDLLIMIVGGTFTLLSTTIQAVLSLIFKSANLLLDMISTVWGLMEALIQDITSAEPEQVPVLPYCDSDPEGSLVCRLFWFAENTVFSGYGALIIPIWVGYLTALIIIWTIKEVKATVLESGKLL